VANLQTGPFPPPIASYVYYQGFLTRDGRRRLLLVNKRDRTIEVAVPGAGGGRQDVVDQTTASAPPASRKLDGETVSLGGYAVAVVTMP
jgi:hypothetical protein